MIDLSPYINQVTSALTELLKPEVFLGASALTAIAGFVGRVAWSGATMVLAWLHSWHLRTVKRHTVALARKQLPFNQRIFRPRCLIVRYGTDPYIEHLASDRERHDGR